MLHGPDFIAVHRAVIGRLGALQVVRIALLGLFDLLLQIGGVQRGDDVARLHLVADLDVDGGDGIGLGGVGHRHMGFAARGHGAGGRDRVFQAGLLQRGRADILVGDGGRRHGGAQEAPDRERGHQQHRQHGGELFVPRQPVLAPGRRNRRVLRAKNQRSAVIFGLFFMEFGQEPALFAPAPAVLFGGFLFVFHGAPFLMLRLCSVPKRSPAPPRPASSCRRGKQGRRLRRPLRPGSTRRPGG